ncbi:MAG TPA: ABC transporter ATP-binding protein [Bacteroidetes bacterium]|nr:ABC transporter ATP-binding protein [Bacteroidota bacterium]
MQIAEETREQQTPTPGASGRKPVIEIRDLVTAYDGRRILDGVNLTVYEGETLAVLGRSGCGKSTLLRHMIGLHRPTSGQILIKGRDITRMTEDEKVDVLKKIGMLFQSAALFNSMTIGENVALPLREHTELEDSTIRIMVRMKLELVGLSGFEDFLPSQLSGGMRKRAGLARAIAMDPEILFCDEPSAGLDPIVAAEIDHLLLKLKQAFRMTMVIVTHEMASVFLIADRIAMMHEGRILAVGTPEEIRANPHPYIQQFLNREPGEEKVDRDAYLRTLTGQHEA